MPQIAPKLTESVEAHSSSLAARVAELEALVQEQKRKIEVLEQRLAAGGGMPGSQGEIGRQMEVLQAVLESAGEGIAAVNTAGEFLFFNREGETIVGIGASNEGPDGWADHYGLFGPDRVTPLAPHEIPLWRAARGEVVNDVELFVRNSHIPAGKLLSVNARPIVDEMGNLTGGVATFRDITDARRAQERLLEQTVTDDMTMIPNQRAFWQRLSQLIAEGGRGRAFCLVMVDVDLFKAFNDCYGHQVGDYVLIAVAQTLFENVRKTDLAARYGGEEFCILFTDVDQRVATGLAEKLRSLVLQVDAPAPVTASFGVCAFSRERHDSGEALIRDADAALYQAKAAGRNRVCAFLQPLPSRDPQ